MDIAIDLGQSGFGDGAEPEDPGGHGEDEEGEERARDPKEDARPAG
jgi:hypothetical protein